VFVKRILWVFLFLVCGGVFNSICAAAPLMVEKNLFAADRKQPAPEFANTSAKAAKPGMAIGNIQLDGVIIRSNSKRAVLRMKNQPAGVPGKKGQPASPFVTVREGQTVGDYRVSKIESKSILLEKDGRTFTVSLFAENKEVAPPSAPPGPASAQQPMAAPGVASQEAGANQPQGVQLQPGHNPANPQQLPPVEMVPPPNPNVAGQPASQRNVAPNVDAPAINQDPNQAAMTIQEEE
jgi:hypothetical protein